MKGADFRQWPDSASSGPRWAPVAQSTHRPDACVELGRSAGLGSCPCPGMPWQQGSSALGHTRGWLHTTCLLPGLQVPAAPRQPTAWGGVRCPWDPTALKAVGPLCPNECVRGLGERRLGQALAEVGVPCPPWGSRGSRTGSPRGRLPKQARAGHVSPLVGAGVPRSDG